MFDGRAFDLTEDAARRLYDLEAGAVMDLIRERLAAGAAIRGIFHDAGVREAVATRLIDVAGFRAAVAARRGQAP